MLFVNLWKIRHPIDNILNLNMDSFKLDRIAFKAQTMKEASNHALEYQKLSWQDRLKVAAYLNSVAYNFDINNPPRMDRTKFSAKSISS